MVTRLFVIALLLAASLAAQEIRTVYLLPMSNNFDQYFANRLRGIYEIVADPLLADAVFTDAIGPAFERKMAELYPIEKEEQAEGEKVEAVGHMGAFRRGRGTIFLVDRRSKKVVWSTYEPIKRFTPEDLDKVAEKIAKRLKAK
jgi:hypothetical protein